MRVHQPHDQGQAVTFVQPGARLRSNSWDYGGIAVTVYKIGRAV
jgi:hypothetical protein